MRRCGDSPVHQKPLGVRGRGRVKGNIRGKTWGDELKEALEGRIREKFSTP